MHLVADLYVKVGLRRGKSTDRSWSKTGHILTAKLTFFTEPLLTTCVFEGTVFHSWRGSWYLLISLSVTVFVCL